MGKAVAKLSVAFVDSRLEMAITCQRSSKMVLVSHEKIYLYDDLAEIRQIITGYRMEVSPTFPPIASQEIAIARMLEKNF